MKTMKKAKSILAAALTLAIAIALLSGCATGGAGAAGTGAVDGKIYNLVYQCAFGSGGGPFE